ncbi:hypothetical protein IW140_005835 [Coemansia sp. RSA 1813]|nr:hypothetical protein EV178_004294 [Coemansia sp. RSA 1646]KAJ1770867.1 hypothetical protein LPJ74_002853 [Coemansia sp. RSA 1843]KAJ2564201.1 hypothetical protein IW140_005835 [Coemansia sp. RSA 1813]
MHDRFNIAKSSGERAILSMALQTFLELQRRRQETYERVRELSRQIQTSERQIALANQRVDHWVRGLGACTESDVRLITMLGDTLAAQESRLRNTKQELVDAEQRLVHIVGLWATSRF